MRVEAKAIVFSNDVAQSVRQVEDAFAPALAALASAAPMAGDFDLLWIGLSLDPWSEANGARASGSFHKATATFHVSAPINYEAWRAGGWTERVEAFADGVRRAVAVVHKTRLDPAARDALSALIDPAVRQVVADPPAKLAELGPPMATIASPPATGLETLKAYRRIDGRLAYRQAWPDGDVVVEHWGFCGERGETRDHSAADEAAKRNVLQAIADQARLDGFRPIPHSRHAMLMVTAPVEGPLTDRHQLEDLLDELTAWLGLGHCDGGASGSGSMEAFCEVVDFKLAKEALTRELAETGFRNFEVKRAP